MDSRSLGLLLIVLGVLIALVGMGVYGRLFSWFGRLPGDIRIQGEHGVLYVPLTSMMIISLVLSLALWIVHKLAR